jgi:hypothetical protein
MVVSCFLCGDIVHHWKDALPTFLSLISSPSFPLPTDVKAANEADGKREPGKSGEHG